MSALSKQLYAFGPFHLDAASRLLLRDGQPVPLTAKPFETLLVLVQNSGKVLSKDELLQTIWPDTVVEEANLAVNISTLRKALGESRGENKYIVTLPGRGYQFVAEVNQWDKEAPPLVLEKYTITKAVIEEQELTPDQTDEPAPSLNGVGQPQLPAKFAGRGLSSRLSLGLWASGAMLLAVLGYWAVTNWRGAPAKVSQVRSIAVLPFRSLQAGGDSSLGLGLADALITRLSNTGAVIVRPTSAIVKYAAAEKNPQEIGAELGVEALLEGRLQRDGDQLRLTVQLVRADNGAPLWAGSFDEQFTHIFTVQRAISEKVAQALTLKLTSEQQQRLVKNYTANTAAFQSYIQGQFYWSKRTHASVRQAMTHFEQAIAADPAYALAYAGLADCHLIFATTELLMSGASREESLQKAKTAALKALELDDTLAEAHTSLAAVQSAAGDPASNRAFERALALNPNYATAYNFYGLTLIAEGRLDEAHSKLTRAVEIDPLAVASNVNLGMALYRQRRYDEALKQFQQSLTLNPDFARTHYGLGLVYAQLGQYDEAIEELERAGALTQSGAVALAALGHLYAVIGRRQEAVKTAARLHEMFARGQATAYYVAMVYAGLGQNDEAFTWLAKPPRKYPAGLLRIDQAFDGLRTDPRFAELMRRHSQ